MTTLHVSLPRDLEEGRWEIAATFAAILGVGFAVGFFLALRPDRLGSEARRRARPRLSLLERTDDGRAETAASLAAWVPTAALESLAQLLETELRVDAPEGDWMARLEDPSACDEGLEIELQHAMPVPVYLVPEADGDIVYVDLLLRGVHAARAVELAESLATISVDPGDFAGRAAG